MPEVKIETGALVAMEGGGWRDLLGRVMPVRAKKASLPVLECVKITVSPTRVEAMVTNLEAWGIASVGHECSHHECRTGSIAVPLQRLKSVVQQADAEEMVEFRAVNDGESVEVSCGNWTARVHAFDGNELPAMGDRDGALYTMPAAALKRALAITAPAVSDDATRYVLNGVLLRCEAGKMIAVATDGRRLVKVWSDDVLWNGDQDFQIIVPWPAVQILLGWLDDGEEDVTLTVGKSFLRVELPNGDVLGTKLIEGNFPDYAKVVPLWKGGGRFNKAVLLGLIKRAMVMTKGTDPHVRLEFCVDGTVRAEAGTVEDSWRETSPLWSREHAPSRNELVKVNGEYMAMLGAGESEGLEMKLPGGAAAPLHLRGVETAGKRELRVEWVVMPVRVAE